MKGHLYLTVFFILSLPLQAAITVEPNGVIAWGTTLTVRIQPPRGAEVVYLEIVRDEDGSGQAESGEKRLLQRTPVRDGEKKGPLPDRDEGAGKIELYWQVKSEVQPGSYIIRFSTGPGRLAEGVLIEIADHSPDALSLVQYFAAAFKQRIDTTPPTLDLLIRDRLRQTRVENTDLWLMDGRTFEMRTRLTGTGGCFCPCWSPDSKRIAYVRRVKEGDQLWMLTLTSGKDQPVDLAKGVQRVTGVPAGGMASPAWSPQGNKIAFLSAGRVWTVNVDGSGLKSIASGRGLQKIAAWSRDGRWLVFAAGPEPATPILGETGRMLGRGSLTLRPEDRLIPALWKVDTAAGRQERLIYDAAWLWLPYLSPDGCRLIFPVEAAALASDLWLAEGEAFGEARRVTDGAYLHFDPAWSPDGQWIVLVSNRQP